MLASLGGRRVKFPVGPVQGKDIFRRYPMCRALRRRNRIMVASLMAPLALIGGWLPFGCGCADGRYEPFFSTQAHARANKSLSHDESPGAGCCACCRDVRGGCCRIQSTADQESVHDSLTRSKRCCRPMIRPSAVPSTCKVARLPERTCPLAVVTDRHRTTVPRVLAGAGEFSRFHPPNDLVIELRRLLI